MCSFGNAVFPLSPTDRKLVRKIENLKKKIVNAEHAVLFNRICIQENLLPKFTNICICIYTP